MKVTKDKNKFVITLDKYDDVGIGAGFVDAAESRLNDPVETLGILHRFARFLNGEKVPILEDRTTSGMGNQGVQATDERVIAENIKLAVTISGHEHMLQMKDEDLGTKRQDFMDHVERLGMLLAIELQDRGILPYKDFAVIDDRKSGNSTPSAKDLRTIGERPVKQLGAFRRFVNRLSGNRKAA